MRVRSDSVSPTVAWAAGPTRPTQYTSHTANTDSMIISATMGTASSTIARPSGLDVLDVAVGADTVAEQLLEMLLDVLLEGLPFLMVVANPFAVRTDGKQHLELLDFLAEAEDALRDLEPGAQLVRVHRLGDEIVRPRLHPGQILLLAAACRDEDEIDVRLAHTGADAAAQFRAVHLRHVPVGDHDGNARQLEQLPSLAAVVGALDVVPGRFRERAELGARYRVVVHDQHGDRVSHPTHLSSPSEGNRARPAPRRVRAQVGHTPQPHRHPAPRAPCPRAARPDGPRRSSRRPT